MAPHADSRRLSALGDMLSEKATEQISSVSTAATTITQPLPYFQHLKPRLGLMLLPLRTMHPFVDVTVRATFKLPVIMAICQCERLT